MKFLVRYGLLGTVVCCYCLLTSLGCTKEFSYEFRPITDSIVPPDSVIDNDSIPVTPIKEPPCSNCDSLIARNPYYWSLEIDNQIYCGKVRSTYYIPERNQFTFLGPAACALDTGILIDAFFGDVSYKNDFTNAQASSVNFQYLNILYSKQTITSRKPHIFSLVVDSFYSATGIAAGHFEGYAQRVDGDSIAVKSGVFRLRLKW